MMKLLIAGLALIALGLGLVVFTDLNPALLFIAGVTCAFVAIIRGAQLPDHGRVVSVGSAVEAESLTQLANYSAAGDRVFDCDP